MLVALDNTWGAGLAFRAFDLGHGLGVDIVMQALTKYPSGGADVLMGSVVTRDEALHQQMLKLHGQLGIGVAANDAEFILKGLPTIALRYHAHDAGRPHAGRLAGHPAGGAPGAAPGAARVARPCALGGHLQRSGGAVFGDAATRR